MYTCIHTYIHTYIHTDIHTYIYIYIYIYMRVCVYVCIIKYNYHTSSAHRMLKRLNGVVLAAAHSIKVVEKV